ncbi:hypothetical protein IVB12_15810 [Bradyrhizobium sp. 179]|uniref:hypothetical protein n=1 Tax=Bradyrhizobium sp. 179 TaxID=2782648 RepID=UPI001FFB5FA6|nr:hypothetical protein [Bradyrhizobium sp. 179]MCK1543382.1 hypothetical protein [Bradyrhizobium sp. 179]
MTDAFRNLVNVKALAGDVGALDDILEVLQAMENMAEEIAHVVTARTAAVKVLVDRLELAFGQAQVS